VCPFYLTGWRKGRREKGGKNSSRKEVVRGGRGKEALRPTFLIFSSPLLHRTYGGKRFRKKKKKGGKKKRHTGGISLVTFATS